MDELQELTAYLDVRTGRPRARRPHHRWEHRYRRRCARYGVTPVVVTFTQEDLFEAYGFLCWWCGRNATEIDHVQAVIDGGQHTLDNVRPCCHRCNADREAERRRQRGLTQVPGQLALELTGPVTNPGRPASTGTGARTVSAGWS